MKTPEKYMNRLIKACGISTIITPREANYGLPIIVEIIQDVKRECLKAALENCPAEEEWLSLLKQRAYKNIPISGNVIFTKEEAKQLFSVIEWAFFKIDLLIKEQGHEDFIQAAYERGKLEGYEKGLINGNRQFDRNALQGIMTQPSLQTTTSEENT